MSDPTPFISVRWQGAEIGGVIQSVNVEDHDRLIDRAQIVVDDPREVAGHIVQEGQTIQVEMGWSDHHAVMFEGVVRRAAPEVQGSRRRVTITALDLSVRLRDRRPNPNDTNYRGTLTDIVRQIVDSDTSHGLTLRDADLSANPNHEYTEQEPLARRAGIRDWDFIQQLAVEHDCRSFVEYNEAESRFYFVSTRSLLDAAPMGMLHQCPGFTELIDFRYQRIASGAAPAYSTSCTDPATGTSVDASALPVSPTAAPAADPAVRSRLADVSDGEALAYDAGVAAAGTATSTPADQVPQVFLPGLPSDPALAERLLRRDPTRVLGLLGEGTTRGNIQLRAKGRLTLEGIATWAEGDWYVARVNHLFTRTSSASERLAGTYRSRFVVTR